MTKTRKLKKIGFCICGSFCTISKAIEQMEILKEKNFEIFPVMSEAVISKNTRFGKAKEIINKIEKNMWKKSHSYNRRRRTNRTKKTSRHNVSCSVHKQHFSKTRKSHNRHHSYNGGKVTS